MIKGRPGKISDKTLYEKWVESQGIPVIREGFLSDVRKVKLEPWDRKGGLGAYFNLKGTDELNDAYICEIPPGRQLKAQRHLYEAKP